MKLPMKLETGEQSEEDADFGHTNLEFSGDVQGEEGEQ